MGSQASRRHGLTVTRSGRGRWRRRRCGWVHWVGLSHSLTLVSVLPLYSLSHLSILFFFFSFFSLVFFAFSVTPFGLWCWVFCFFFFFNRLPGSWAPGLAGWWAGGVHDILGGDPSKKLKGAQALFFLVLWKFYLLKKNFFELRGGSSPL